MLEEIECGFKKPLKGLESINTRAVDSIDF